MYLHSSSDNYIYQQQLSYSSVKTCQWFKTKATSRNEKEKEFQIYKPITEAKKHTHVLRMCVYICICCFKVITYIDENSI